MDTPSSGATVSRSSPISDKKFNLVVYGITEHPPKTNRQTRLNKDLECLLTFFSKIDNKLILLPLRTISVWVNMIVVAPVPDPY